MVTFCPPGQPVPVTLICLDDRMWTVVGEMTIAGFSVGLATGLGLVLGVGLAVVEWVGDGAGAPLVRGVGDAPAVGDAPGTDVGDAPGEGLTPGDSSPTVPS